jgi:frizzled protein 1/7
LQVLKKVEGDVLTGTCFVGLWDVWSLRWLLITPLVIYISIGTLFLAAGLTSLIKIRTLMKQDGGKTDKLEKLIMRIGIFSMLYTVPACIIIGKSVNSLTGRTS